MSRQLRRLALLAALALSLAPFAPVARAQQRPSDHALPPVIHVDNGPNAPSQLSKHYVVLVSLDGFRYDYPKLYGAHHLLAIGRRGASAPSGMIPAYPSLTFPNHYTLITGLYPEHHGIVANSFYDPARKQIYSYRNANTVTDGSWYGGTPLWSLAEQQGMRTACFFWPGSEAKIAGERPTWYLHYTNDYPDEQRIDKVIEWLKLPAAQRPHFITLYYPNVDHQGHEHGPDSPQVREAVHHVDELMGILEQKLDALNLPIDLIIVSDHGMARVQGNWITLDKYADLDDFTTVGPLLYPKSEADAAHAYQQLKAAQAGFTAYRRANIPAELHFNSNPREGDPVIVPQGPYLIRAHAPAPGHKQFTPVGEHGYNPFQMTSMRAIFFAEGPDIRPGTKLKPFENVNVYPFIAKILGLKAPKVDGNPWILSTALRGEAK
jgi:predicted AlkP superfamily pyrophosphatase or phosphodiesterase